MHYLSSNLWDLNAGIVQICSMFYKDVIGQDFIKKQMHKSANEGRIAHAVLIREHLVGGGFALAWAYARYLQCTDRNESDSCGKCSSCLQISKLAHPDVHFSFPVINDDNKNPTSDSFLSEWRHLCLDRPYFDLTDWLTELGDSKKQPIISTKEAENILHKTQLKTFNSPWKIVIIWMAERLNSAASNKLLKIIEEPEPGTVFILIVRSTEKMLSTILSRCQEIHLPTLQEEEIAAYLQARYSVQTEMAQLASRFCEGDVARAYRLAHTDVSLEEFATEFVKWSRMCYNARLLEIVPWINDMSRLSREGLQGFIRFSSFLFKESLNERVLSNGFSHPSFQKVEFRMEGFSRLFNPKRLNRMLAALDLAYYEIGRNLNPKPVLFALSTELMRTYKMKD